MNNKELADKIAEQLIDMGMAMSETIRFNIKFVLNKYQPEKYEIEDEGIEDDLPFGNG